MYFFYALKFQDKFVVLKIDNTKLEFVRKDVNNGPRHPDATDLTWDNSPQEFWC